MDDYFADQLEEERRLTRKFRRTFANRLRALDVRLRRL